jgi:hypothetical protein
MKRRRLAVKEMSASHGTAARTRVVVDKRRTACDGNCGMDQASKRGAFATSSSLQAARRVDLFIEAKAYVRGRIPVPNIIERPPSLSYFHGDAALSSRTLRAGG